MFVPLTPLRCLERALDLYPRKVGIVCGEREFTYAEFGERARRLASGLVRLGVAPGDRVAFLSFNTHKLLESYYGVVQARAVIMPMNVRLSQQEIITILRHAGARYLFFEPEFAGMVPALRAACPELERAAALDGEKGPGDLIYEEIVESGEAEAADIFSYDENGIAELFYTSGSTGTPKGVALTHRTLYLHALGVMGVCEDRDYTVDLHTIPLFHANGWGRPQVSTMLGFKQIMVRRFEPPTVFRLIEQHRATEMSVVPVMANMLLNAPERERHDLSSMRRILIGGAAASPELIARMEKAFGCRVEAGYGLTETAPVLTMSREKSTYRWKDEEDRLRRAAMAGWPVVGVRVRVVDLHGNDVPRDMKTMGEVVAQGDNVMEGYYREPEATAAVIEDRWFHTGDMAVWDEDGWIHIVDRKKEIIISGGENISSIEVEKAIFAHEAVLECAVVAAPDEQWGEAPAALVVLKEGRKLSKEELLAFLAERLGRFKLPKVIEFWDEPLPKTGTGKIRKNVLKHRFWEGKEKRVQG
jgi:fatty-acyl-CoA synthase